MKLADAAVTLVANGSTRQDFLRFFGRCFVRYFSHYGYEKFIKVNKLSFSLFLPICYAAAVVCLPEIMKIKKQGSSCWFPYLLFKQTRRIYVQYLKKKRKKERLRRYEEYEASSSSKKLSAAHGGKKEIYIQLYTSKELLV
jgi:hypothetical protein